MLGCRTWPATTSAERAAVSFSEIAGPVLGCLRYLGQLPQVDRDLARQLGQFLL